MVMVACLIIYSHHDSYSYKGKNFMTEMNVSAYYVESGGKISIMSDRL